MASSPTSAAAALLALLLSGCGDEASGTDVDGAGWTVEEGDCDDENPSIYPGADEVVGDGVDQDCDGGDTCYRDGDEDGYGSTETVTSEDLDCLDAGESSLSTDCDDDAWAVNPGAEEVCDDGIDNDCDGRDRSCHLVGEISSAEADGKLVGEEAGDEAAGALTTSDMDGDGLDDILVGAPMGWRHGPGAVYLLHSPLEGTVDLSLADAKLVGVESDDLERVQVAAGDVDGDGKSDVLVGSLHNSSYAVYGGIVYLVLGPVSGEVDLGLSDARLGGATESSLGSSLAAGDVNDDGLADIIVGDSTDSENFPNAGAVLVVYGPVSGDVDPSSADVRLEGVEVGDRTGEAVETGDYNGDGVTDVLVTSRFTGDYKGTVYVVLGPLSGVVPLSDADATLTGQSYAYFGHPLASGDTNGDGFDDVIAWADGYARAYVFHGSLEGAYGMSDSDATLWLPTSSAGSSLASGDVDGDGVEDLLIGDTGNDSTGDIGAAYLAYGPFSGQAEVTEVSARLFSETANDRMGWSVAIGDLNGDSRGDVLVGATHDGEGGEWAGAAYLFYEGGL